MSEVAIRVENLGKKYSLRHLRDQRYVALRDVLVEKATGLFRRNGKGKEDVPTREEFWALKDINFEVKEGEVIGIIGRNGAGKSTLLKILSRITDPTEGRVRIRGRVASLLEVGTGFHPELTGRENIFLNGAILGMTRAEIARKFDEIVSFAEVEKFLDTPVKRYSSGMYVRLAFAVAAHLEPEILVVDEVLAVGDVEFQKRCLGKMNEVARAEGRTVLFVSHNMTAILQLCSTALLLAAGRIGISGEASRVVHHYLQRATTSSEVSREPEDAVVKITKVQVEQTRCVDTTDLLLLLEVTAKEERLCSLELKVRDQYGAPLGLASVGLLDPSAKVHLRSGTQHYRCHLVMPRLARGSYSLEIQLADPMIEVLDVVPQLLTFDVLPEPLRGAKRALEASWGYGPTDIPMIIEQVEA
jgi:lipopolysaccharide transport system ATP-binding protein